MVTPNHTINAAKAQVRSAALARRESMSDMVRSAASDVIATRTDNDVFALVPAGSTVSLYANKGSEVATAKMEVLARRRGLRVCFPKVIAGDRRMSFFYAVSSELIPSGFGVAEPAAHHPRAEYQEIAAVVMPALAMDRSGGRVGWGKGYYDSTLPLMPQVMRVAVIFECQLVTSVHAMPHDQNVNLIITEQQTVRVLRVGLPEDV
jgi:5-formyltetrahydrofolate cyclo-ligase